MKHLVISNNGNLHPKLVLPSTFVADQDVKMDSGTAIVFSYKISLLMFLSSKFYGGRPVQSRSTSIRRNGLKNDANKNTTEPKHMKKHLHQLDKT